MSDLVAGTWWLGYSQPGFIYCLLRIHSIESWAVLLVLVTKPCPSLPGALALLGTLSSLLALRWLCCILLPILRFVPWGLIQLPEAVGTQ